MQRVKETHTFYYTIGLSDPFVVVDLLPKRIFFDYPAQQTEVQKRTLNPVFEESFEL